MNWMSSQAPYCFVTICVLGTPFTGPERGQDEQTYSEVDVRSFDLNHSDLIFLSCSFFQEVYLDYPSWNQTIS